MKRACPGLRAQLYAKALRYKEGTLQQIMRRPGESAAAALRAFGLNSCGQTPYSQRGYHNGYDKARRKLLKRGSFGICLSYVCIRRITAQLDGAFLLRKCPGSGSGRQAQWRRAERRDQAACLRRAWEGQLCGNLMLDMSKDGPQVMQE